MNYIQQPMQNLEDISDPTTAIDMELVLMAKAFTLNDTTPTNNNQRSSSNPRNMQIAQPGMNMDQDRHMLMVEDNVGNQNGNVAAARAEGNGDRNNENQIRCYNCQGVDHYARNSTVKPRKMDDVYLQTQLQIAQKEEAGIQLKSEEFDFMAAAGAYDEIEEVTANCTLKDNLQQASTSGTQADNAPIYDLNGSAEVHHDTNCYDNDIFNMFTQEENVEHNAKTVEQHPATVKETRAYFESLYSNLAMEVEKVYSVNHKMKETNAELTTELVDIKIKKSVLKLIKKNMINLKGAIKSLFIKSNVLLKR
ncbi:hypothetical protein Tco_1263882 [Tanacetum coccineum]